MDGPVCHCVFVNKHGSYHHSLTQKIVSLRVKAKPFIFIPGALWSHSMRHYLEYLNMSAIDPSHYYVSEFEAVNSTNRSNDDDDGMVDDDKWINPPDDEVYPQEEEEIVTLTFDENVVVVQDEVVVVDVQ
jgi:hypothetical protein